MNRLLGVLLLAGCVREATPARFADRPVVTASDDRRPIAEPSERKFHAKAYLSDVMIFDPIVGVFDRPRRHAAADTNALDEAVDSTWFANRSGVTPELAARGPGGHGAPVLPLEVVSAKSGGANPGFIAKDARGQKYIVKFDTANAPEMQTATNAIVGRLLWTLGYNVPNEQVVYFERSQLAISPKLKSIDDADLDRMLAAATRRGSAFRASASEFLPGVPKGGWPATGVRDDDPNDRVPHERRRTLRGLGVFAAWLNHTDMKPDNTLDMYTDGHLVHYLVDFGEALSGQQSEKDRPQIGYEYGWDWAAQGKALVSFGFWQRPWEAQVKTPWPAIGYFGAAAFDPRAWRERYPYAPFHRADRADRYWAVKKLLGFDRPMLEAIVATGQLSDPAAARYLVDTLLARRDKIARAYLADVTPLDQLAIVDGAMCGVDLARRHGFAAGGELVGPAGAIAIGADGRVCAPLASTTAYEIVRVRIRRPDGRVTPPLAIHRRGDRILGLER